VTGRRTKVRHRPAQDVGRLPGPTACGHCCARGRAHSGSGGKLYLHPCHNVRGVHSGAIGGRLIPFEGAGEEVTAVSAGEMPRSPRSESVFTLRPGRRKGGVSAMHVCCPGGKTVRMAYVSRLFLYCSSIIPLVLADFPSLGGEAVPVRKPAAVVSPMRPVVQADPITVSGRGSILSTGGTTQGAEWAWTNGAS
jgi:hypothetical protein